MHSTYKQDNKQFKKAIHHLIIGFLLMLKGSDKFVHHQFIGGLMLLMGAIIIIYFLFDVIAERKSTALKRFVHLFEAIALFFTAYVYFTEGKTYLPYLTWMASLVFLVWFLVDTNRVHKERRNSESKAS